nr:PepSY domain-containing protein [Sphingomonas sp. CFBP8993]
MTVLLALLAAPMGSPPMIQPPLDVGGDQRRGDQIRAYQQRKEGNLSLREIEARVVPTMRDSQYIGFDYDAGAAVYTLKFLRNGTVIWVEVDGRTGKVIGRTDG